MQKTCICCEIDHSHPHRLHRFCSMTPSSVPITPTISVRSDEQVTQRRAGASIIHIRQRQGKTGTSQRLTQPAKGHETDCYGATSLRLQTKTNRGVRSC
jgi:hypothetical protein